MQETLEAGIRFPASVRPLFPLLAVVVLLAAGCVAKPRGDAPATSPTLDPSSAPSPSTPARPSLSPARVSTPAAAPSCSPLCAVAVLAHPWQDFEPAVAVDPSDPAHIIVAIDDDPRSHAQVYVAEPVAGTGLVNGPGAGEITVRVTRDGGATWSGGALPRLGTAAPTSGWSARCNFGDPQAFVGPDGAAYVLGFSGACSSDLHVDDEMTALVFAKSADGGLTWGEPTLVWGAPAPVQFEDKPWAGIDPKTGAIAVAWTGFTAGFVADSELYVSESTDGGKTWSDPPHTIERTQYPATMNYETALAWGVDGALHVAHVGTCDGAPCIVDSVSRDHATTWSTTRVASYAPWTREGARAPSNAYPSISVDRSDGRVVVAFPTAPQGDIDVVVAWSDDGGATWSAPARLEDDAPGNGVDQAMQGVAAADGIVHAIFLDRRADPTNVSWAATYARFDPRNGTLLNAPLESPWTPDPAGKGSAWAGDYNTASVAGGTVAFAWTRVTPPKAGEKGDMDLDVYAAVLPAR